MCFFFFFFFFSFFFVLDCFTYKSDFDQKGVIYYLGKQVGITRWRNPSLESTSGVKVTYCDGHQGDGPLPELILQYYDPVRSYTRSGWCLDLGEKYSLRLTNYTLRQIGSSDKTFLQNFELYGSLCNDDDDWCLLSRQHRVDWKSQCFSHIRSKNKIMACKTKTWNVEGESKACRYFKIVQMKGTSLFGKQKMSLAGMELYGYLSVLELAWNVFEPICRVFTVHHSNNNKTKKKQQQQKFISLKWFKLHRLRRLIVIRRWHS